LTNTLHSICFSAPRPVNRGSLLSKALPSLFIPRPEFLFRTCSSDHVNNLPLTEAVFLQTVFVRNPFRFVVIDIFSSLQQPCGQNPHQVLASMGASFLTCPRQSATAITNFQHIVRKGLLPRMNPSDVLWPFSDRLSLPVPFAAFFFFRPHSGPPLPKRDPFIFFPFSIDVRAAFPTLFLPTLAGLLPYSTLTGVTEVVSFYIALGPLW